MACAFQGWLSVCSRWRAFGANSHQQNTENVEKINELIPEDHHQTIHELSQMVGHGACKEILIENLNMHWFAVKFVPQLMTAVRSLSILTCRLGSVRWLRMTPLSSVGSSWPHFIMGNEIWVDLTLHDLTLLPKMKLKLKGLCFDTINGIQMELQMVLDSLQEKDFHSDFKDWKRCWDLCVCSQGDYVEGDDHQI